MTTTRSTKIVLLLSLTSLLWACSSDDDNPVTPSQVKTVSVSGKASFDFVPTSQKGLDYASTTAKPVRAAVVEAIVDNKVVSSGVTSETGTYSLDVPQNSKAHIRVKAQLLSEAAAKWDFKVVDNTNSQALYAIDSSTFDTASASISDKNLHAPSGWDGSSYSSTRSAAPFAILDLVHKAVDKIQTADPTVNLPALNINWSVNNASVEGDKALGQISTSHFSEGQLYILGKADSDTDEYDDHIIAHEWGHYLEAVLSRADSIGGSHTTGDKLDPRLAFGEGFGNAFSGMVSDDPMYVDTLGPSQGELGVVFDLDQNNADENSTGWYSEISIQSLLYDLYDSSEEDGLDNVALGFTPIYKVLVGKQKTTESFTTIYSFIHHLKTENPDSVEGINALLRKEKITDQAVDEWDSTNTETNDAGDAGILPVYTNLTIGAPAVKVCNGIPFGPTNKVQLYRFIRFHVETAGNYTITVTPVNNDKNTKNGDGIIVLYQQGKEVAGADDSKAGGVESFSHDFTAGNHSLAIIEVGLFNGTTEEDACFELVAN